MHNFILFLSFLNWLFLVVFCEVSCGALQLSCQVLPKPSAMHDLESVMVNPTLTHGKPYIDTMQA